MKNLNDISIFLIILLIIIKLLILLNEVLKLIGLLKLLKLLKYKNVNMLIKYHRRFDTFEKKNK